VTQIAATIYAWEDQGHEFLPLTGPASELAGVIFSMGLISNIEGFADACAVVRSDSNGEFVRPNWQPRSGAAMTIDDLVPHHVEPRVCIF
jgi:hypothetical protein